MIKRLTEKKYAELRDKVAYKKKVRIPGSKSMGWFSKIDDSYICHDSDQSNLKFMIKNEFTEIQNKDNNSEHTANIAYCAVNKAWYGWSHRAIQSYKVGSIFTLDSSDGKKYNLRKGTILKTIQQCKQAAKAFAEFVS